MKTLYINDIKKCVVFYSLEIKEDSNIYKFFTKNEIHQVKERLTKMIS